MLSLSVPEDRFNENSSAILHDVIWSTKDSQGKFVESIIVFSIAPTYGLVTWGAKTFAGTALTDVGSRTSNRHLKSFNPLAPDKYGYNFKSVFFTFILRIDILSNSCEADLRWLSQNSIDDKSIMVLVMARFHQRTSHYLSQFWQICGTIWRH